MKNRKIHLIIDITLITSFFVTMAWLIHLIHGWATKEFAYSSLIGIVGLTTGNLVGIYLSPFSKDEKKEFTKLQTTVLSFVVGFLASKVEPIMSYLMQDARIITDPAIGSRTVIFVICLIFSSIYSYVYRKYYIEEALGNAASEDTKNK